MRLISHIVDLAVQWTITRCKLLIQCLAAVCMSECTGCGVDGKGVRFIPSLSVSLCDYKKDKYCQDVNVRSGG
jgi:hypothetical protein